MHKESIKSLFISDVHLGSGLSRIDDLLALLRQYEMEYLYLVGDIIDNLEDDESRLFIGYVLRLVEDGVKVTYLPGNHDKLWRHFTPLTVFGVNIVNECTHYIGSYKLLITHGDQFDPKIQDWFWNLVGIWCYTAQLRLNAVSTLFGEFIRKLCKQHIHYLNRIFNHVDRIQNSATAYAGHYGYNGVLVGHTHIPNIVLQSNVDYFNTGNWIESSTAIVEYFDGAIGLLDCDSGVEPVKFCLTKSRLGNILSREEC